MHDAVKEHARTPFREEVWRQLAEGIRFVQGDVRRRRRVRPAARRRSRSWTRRAAPAATTRSTCRSRRAAFPRGLQAARAARAGRQPADGSWRRVVIEKPFGHDLASARSSTTIVAEVFRPDDVFRIDHYLGKETVQNLLALRFANQLFEPIWNANYVDHVQITMAEDIGIGGRAGYYDGIGAARDVIQNHLLQLLALTAMEEPASFEADGLRAEKIKVLSRGQAARATSASTPPAASTRPGWQGGEKVVGYLEEEGIDPQLHHRDVRRDPGRHRQPPLGRRAVLPAHRQAPGPPRHRDRGRVQARAAPAVRVHRTEELGQNALVIRVQPDEGVTLRFGSKVPGTAMEVRDVTMDFGYGARVHRVHPRGLRAADPRRPARRPAAVPAARGGRAVLEDPRPDRGVLGGARQARAVPLRAPGGRSRRTR